MAEITLEGIAKVMQTELEPVNTRLGVIEETLEAHTKTLANHTTSLDKLLKAKTTKDDNNIVSSDRLKVLEEWGQKVGKQIGLKLEV